MNASSEPTTTESTEMAASSLDAQAIRTLVPPMVADWIDLMGISPTLALVDAYPGVQLKVPMGRKAGKLSRRLVNILGDEAADAFMERHGGEHLTVPRCAGLTRALRDAEIIAAYDGGEKLHDLALEHGLTVRQLRNILNRPCATTSGGAPRRAGGLGRLGDGNPNQTDLFNHE